LLLYKRTSFRVAETTQHEPDVDVTELQGAHDWDWSISPVL